MCGIAGKVYNDAQRRVDRAEIALMCDTIVHRGPDQDGIYIHGPVGLGSRRLSIIDVAGGQMPIANEDQSIWIVYNGEVYNFPELRARLEAAGHLFQTHTDTEAIVHLYEEVGTDFARLLNGMFACAIWDQRRERLILARDQLGIKPLYYAQLPDRLVFGSELKTILADGVDRSIDPIALHDYLSLNYVPGPRSIFSAIKKLQPGHILTWDRASGALHIEQYWDVPRSTAATRAVKLSGSLEADLLDLLQTVVADQLISDVPLGAFLSGGIDSSLVVALMSRVSDQPVKTFSIGFAEKSYNELPYARLVAEQYRTDHHELILEPDALATVQAMAQYFDEPFADSSSLAVYAVSELAAKHVKVALSGDGGDEVFGGYATYQADQLARIYRRLPALLGTHLLPQAAQLLPTSERKVSFDFKLKRFTSSAALPPLAAHVGWKSFLSEAMKQRLYAEDRSATIRPTVDLLQPYYDQYHEADLLNRLFYIDTKVQLVDDMLVKVDRMSMAHSLEVRVPLLDVRLVEWMARLPSNLKVRNLTLKYMLKRVAAQVLPAPILQRRKAGFSVPLNRWIKADLQPLLRQQLNHDALEAQGIFNPAVVQELLQEHQSGRVDWSRSIWNLLMFSLWYERYVRCQR